MARDRGGIVRHIQFKSGKSAPIVAVMRTILTTAAVLFLNWHAEAAHA
jgi:hypothetical protein